MVSRGLALTAALLLAATAATAQELSGSWKIEGAAEVSFKLARADAAWQGATRHPQSGEARRLTLLYHGSDRWTLVVERPTTVTGITTVIGGGAASGAVWGRPVHVSLKKSGLGGTLKGSGFKVRAPHQKPPVVGVPSLPVAERPVVRVLITGFDRFPTLQNHPTWRSTPIGQRQAKTNPSGWSVRHFDPASLDPELVSRARIEVHVLTDVPVLYVEGARRICDEIARVDADVAISFGVGSDGNVDADVESQCFNSMDDCSEAFSGDAGPFQLPASWPPTGSTSSWSDADQAWLWRYPDNAGVSYNGQPIDPAAPDELRSSLPVARIVSRVKAQGLSAHDGQGGPGRYICNNVMFKVVQTQAARGRLGGFIHLPQWSESKQDQYLKVVKTAIEESARAFLERSEIAQAP